MWNSNRILIVMILLNALWFTPIYAQDNTCYFMAPDLNDVWVIVYEQDEEGNRGKIIFNGKIPAGKSVRVTSSTGLIRYQFKSSSEEPYEGDLDRSCYQDITILVE